MALCLPESLGMASECYQWIQYPFRMRSDNAASRHHPGKLVWAQISPVKKYMMYKIPKLGLDWMLISMPLSIQIQSISWLVHTILRKFIYHLLGRNWREFMVSLTGTSWKSICLGRKDYICYNAVVPSSLLGNLAYFF